MTGFRTALRVERIEDESRHGRGTWRLLGPLVYASALLGGCSPVVVPEGFVTDFASVPRVPVAWLVAGGLGHAAAVVHDWLYTTHQTDRATADAVLREAAQRCGVSAWRAWVMWCGVRLGGAGAWLAAGPAQPPDIQLSIGNP